MALQRVSMALLLCHYIAVVGSLNDEGSALLLFKQFVEHDGYLNNWNSSDITPCSWHGVTCREEKVLSLSIPNKKISGFLHPAVGILSSLRHINLRNNNLFGSLPVDLFNIKGLQSLVLSGNSFSGCLPAEIGNLRHLQSLDVSQNSFNGSIPFSLLLCKKLRVLLLSQNSFSGSLPDKFGTDLIHIQTLNLSSNSLSGLIPDNIGNLSNLQGIVDLSHNLFGGSIPASLGILPDRVYLDLSFNNLSGPIPQNGALANLGPTAFIGNPFLCGPPLKIMCSLSSSLVHEPQQNSGRSSHNSAKWSISSVVITTAVAAMVGICLVGLLFSYWYKKVYVRKQAKHVGGRILEEKSIIRREMFCFRKDDFENLSENMEQHSFVKLDSQVDFDLERLLRASAFLLGKSGIGLVYKVVLEHGVTVAVRRLGGGFQRFKEFQTEVEAIGKLRHPNIVSLRAYCWSANEKLLIYDYIPNGDLTTAIHGRAGIISLKPLSWPARLRIIRGVAKGLVFLHESSPKKYVHGNLTPNNVLLGESMIPHITDFGLGCLANIAEEPLPDLFELSTSGTPQQSSPYQFTPTNLTPTRSYYQSPEAIKAVKPSQKWDVYSYGVILLEMISGKWPVMQMGSSEMDLVRWIQLSIELRKSLLDILDPFLAHDLDNEDEIVAVLKIALACVQKSPERRPSMRHVIDSLDRVASYT